jgi:hypothetical protein
MTKSRDGRTIESDPTEPFKGLCQFVEWWEAFKASHCEGLHANWSCNDDLVVRFVFRNAYSVFNYKLDLKDRYIPKAVFEMQVGLLKLQAVPIITKPNVSES